MKRIGWIVVHADTGAPYRQSRGRSWWFRREPIKVYGTKGRAETYAPRGCTVVEAYVPEDAAQGTTHDDA